MDMDLLAAKVSELAGFVWNGLLLYLLVGTGIIFTIRTRFIQVRKFGAGFRRLFGSVNLNGEKAGKEGMSSFQAVATSIAAQVGTGNITGCATAMISGGPGAIFWMWLAAFFGMATIYGEAVLAQTFKTKDETGHVIGGPVYYIRQAFKGTFGKILAGFFALAIIFALGFTGNMVQSNAISNAFQEALGIPTWIVGVVLAVVAAFIFLGGVTRIAAVTEKLVPFMALFYVVLALGVVVINYRRFPAVLASIVGGAFDPQAFTFSALLQAMGFTFFSLCVGCGCMMTYGSYLDDKTNVLRSCSWIAFLSVIASIMGGLMIMPSVFAFGLDPTAGPGLTFITMPAVFAQMPMGQLFAVMFYLCLAVAAITSSVSMIEILVSYLVDEQKMSRPKAAVLSTIALAVVGILPCLSFGLLSDVKMFNGRTFFDVFDFFTSNLSLPLGGLVILYLAGYTCWDRVKNTAPEKWQWLLKLMLRVFSPILVLVVLISGLI